MSSEEFEYFFDAEELEPFSPVARTDGRIGPAAKLIAGRGSRASCQPGTGQDPAGQDPGSATDRTITPTRSRAAVKTDELPPDKLNGKAGKHRSQRDEGRLKPQAAAAPSDVSADQTPSAATYSKPASDILPDRARTHVRHLLSVHALGQFVFCARSAILAAETGDEADIDEPPPRLDYLPNFDLERIEEWLSKSIWQLWLALLLVAGLTAAMAAAVALSSRILFYPALAGCIVGVMWLLQLVAVVLELSARRRAALRAETREPDPRIDGITPVNWWSMLKAGFESVTYQRPFRHPELPLEGNPWRILERGSLRIPVVQSGSEKLGPGKNQVFAKHRIRLAAYAMLLEAMGHVEVPYGLIFPSDSTRGLAIPITAELREEVVRRLREFWQTLRRSQNGESEPRPPRDHRRCEKCRHGKPVLITEKEIAQARQAGARLLVLQHHSGRRLHCLCGDRFGSAPPHGAALKLGLTAILE